MKCFIVVAIYCILSVYSVASESDKKPEHQPDFSDVKFIARAVDSGYELARFQVYEPRWLYVKQGDEELKIVGGTYDVVEVHNEPVIIPPKLRERIKGLTRSTDEAKEIVKNGPFSGHRGVFALFDSNKRLVALVYNWHGVLVTNDAKAIKGDTFQRTGEWESYQSNAKLLGDLDKIAPVHKRKQSPFEKWAQGVEKTTLIK